MLGGYTQSSPFFSNSAEKNLLIVKNFLSVAKMASLVYERENCGDLSPPKSDVFISLLFILNYFDLLDLVCFVPVVNMQQFLWFTRFRSFYSIICLVTKLIWFQHWNLFFPSLLHFYYFPSIC